MLSTNDLKEIGNLMDSRVKPLHEGQKRLENGQQEIKATQQEHGEKLDHLLEEAGRNRTAMKTLEKQIEATNEELTEIKKRQRPRHAD